MFFDYLDGAFRVSITRTRVKYRLLQEAPQVTLVVDDAPTYRTVVVSGRAEIQDDDAALLALSRSLRAKYGYASEDGAEDGAEDGEQGDAELLHALHEEQRVVVVITPEQVLSWAGG